MLLCTLTLSQTTTRPRPFTCFIDDEARRDGLSVVLTSLPQTERENASTVRTYKHPGSVERAFRSLKTVDIKVRPAFHRTEEPRVRAHVLLYMLADRMEWYMRQNLKLMLFDAEGAEAWRRSIVALATSSMRVRAKAATEPPPTAIRYTAFRILIDTLASIARNTVAPCLDGTEPCQITTRPTPLQKNILDHLGVRL